MADVLVREGDMDWARPIARAALRDGRLSWGARGLYVFLWDLPLSWQPRAAHLTKMGPDGSAAVLGRLQELRAVGALRLEVIRGEAGRLVGRRWVLVAADRWAKAWPLAGDPQDLVGGAAENAVSRFSAKPMIGDPDAKVHQSQGLANLRSTTATATATATAIPPHWEAAIAVESEQEAAQRGLRNPGGFRRKLLERYQQTGGPDPVTTAEVVRRREAAQRRAEEKVVTPPPTASRDRARAGLAAAKAKIGLRPADPPDPPTVVGL